MRADELVDSLLALAERQVINAPGDDPQAKVLILETAKAVEDLVDALKFYAAPATWERPRQWGDPQPPAGADRGELARAALVGVLPAPPPAGSPLEALQFYADQANYPPVNTSAVAIDRGARARAALPLLERRTR